MGNSSTKGDEKKAKYEETYPHEKSGYPQAKGECVDVAALYTKFEALDLDSDIKPESKEKNIAESWKAMISSNFNNKVQKNIQPEPSSIELETDETLYRMENMACECLCANTGEDNKSGKSRESMDKNPKLRTVRAIHNPNSRERPKINKRNPTMQTYTPIERKKAAKLTKRAEEIVKAFFDSCSPLRPKYDYRKYHSILRACPTLWNIHQRALQVQKHVCMPRSVNVKTDNAKYKRKPLRRDTSCQTEFRKETWIHRKTTIRHGNDFLNVVSALKDVTDNKEEQDDEFKIASKQNSVLRLTILGVLGKTGVVDKLKEKLKAEQPDFDVHVDEHKSKLISLCRAKVESIAVKYERDMGPLPLEHERFTHTLQNFVISLSKSFAWINKPKQTEKDSPRPTINQGTTSMSKYLTPELEVIRSQIIQQHHDRTAADENKHEASQASSDSFDNKAHGDNFRNTPLKPAINENHPNYVRARSDEDNSFHFDINPVGPFDRGTHYRTDGEIVIEKCKRGSRKDLLVKPQKVKTRGIPNKHLRQASTLKTPDVECLETNDSKDYEDGFEIEETNTSVNSFELEELKSCNSDAENNTADFETALHEHIDIAVDFDKELIEYTEDKRHLTVTPSKIIQGKKNDCDLLGEKYGPKTNKKRQKGDKKKRNRSKMERTTLQFGLNVNNSADDPDLWSTDEEDQVTNSPQIVYSSGRLVEGYEEACYWTHSESEMCDYKNI